MTTLRQFLLKMGFRFRTVKTKSVVMESARIVAWRYKYLQKLKCLRRQGYNIIFLDETWFHTHDVNKKGWDDRTCNCTLIVPVSRGKRIMVLHAGGKDGWVPNCLYLSAKNIGDAKADSHDDMNAEIFERWFENTLLANLPRNVRLKDSCCRK